MLFSPIVQAQKITQIKSEIKDGTIIITYNLHGPEKQKFLISLYAFKNSEDLDEIEITSAKGDVGYGVKPGKKKKIIWNPSNEGISDMQNIKFSLQAMASGVGKKKK